MESHIQDIVQANATATQAMRWSIRHTTVSTTLVWEVKLYFFGDSQMTDEDGEIVFNTQAKHTPSEAVASGTLPDSSDTKMHTIMEGLHSITSQNKGIKLKIEQHDHKADAQVQKISECFENLGARVSNQTAQMEFQLKLHGDKLAAKINVL